MESEVLKTLIGHSPWAAFCFAVWWFARADRNKSDERWAAYGAQYVEAVIEQTKVMQALKDSIDRILSQQRANGEGK